MKTKMHTIPYHTIPIKCIPYHIHIHIIPYNAYHTIPYHTMQSKEMPCKVGKGNPRNGEERNFIPYHTIPYTKGNA
jgi:hypothetical protein